jgi:hypothetical protein
MIRKAAFTAAVLLASAAPTARALAADAGHPTVVELFQSQGCSSCPPANANVIALSARPDILALSFQVTYWDQLGWKDTFGSPRNTARQWEYARALKHDNVWTPQVIVNGRADVIGVRKGEIEQAIVRVDRGVSGPAVTISAGRVTIAGAPPAHPAGVWLVRYDPNVVLVPIGRGENGGTTLPHKNVVRSLTRLGDWTGAARTYVLPPAPAGLKTAVLVQAGPGGPILAASRG